MSADDGGPDASVRAFVVGSGLVEAGETPRYTPLAGGIASDIWKVETGRRVLAIKKALATLRVARDWQAPVSRNASEVDWLMAARAIVPDAVPAVLAHDAALGAFAMDYFDPAFHPVWKAELAAARADPVFSARVGTTLVAIHAATAGDAGCAARFANDALFEAIRLAPYLRATGEAHPDLADALAALADDTLATKRALVHGDVSPKNILVGPRGPVFLDAECAWYGDPAFDLAFCLNHLLLKVFLASAARDDLAQCFRALTIAYLEGVVWEPRGALEARAARLLPALLLARVDGLSPVEYVTEEATRDKIRRIARPLVEEPPTRLADIDALWYDR